MTTKEAIRNHTNTNHDLYKDFEQVKTKAYETGEAIYKTASHAKDKASDFLGSSIDDATTKVTTLQEAVVSYVKTNPGKSLTFAAIAGVIAALIIKK